MFRSSVVILLALGVPAVAQRVAAGARVGGRAGGDVDSYWATSESKRYVLGPTVEVRLLPRLSFEADALYRRIGLRTADGGFWGSTETGYRANAWEFPLLAKYSQPLAGARLSVSGGYAPRRISGSFHTEVVNVNPTSGQSSRYEWSDSWKPDVTHGVVAGAGIEVSVGHLGLAPEFRYTRWNQDPLALYGSHGFSVSMSRNQYDVLLGMVWK